MISSYELPQGDNLNNIVEAIIGIHHGARTDLEIANSISHFKTSSTRDESKKRQGRYYRLIAQLLGLVVNENNTSSLTLSGKQLLQNPTIQSPLFRSSVLRMGVFQLLIQYLTSDNRGKTKASIIQYFCNLKIRKNDGNLIAKTTIERRVITLLSWLRKLNMIAETGGYFKPINVFPSDESSLVLTDPSFPIFPKERSLTEYNIVEERLNKAKAEVRYFVDQSKKERADKAHIKLVNLVANKLKAINLIPTSNVLIDLATKNEEEYIFEMKSVTKSNEKSQIRKGISQLYEYRYLHNLPNANLVLVIEKPLTEKMNWMLDYLETDRKIHLIWDGDGNLYGTEHTRKKLEFLNFA
ncbi:MAG: hypothetical protein AAGG68_03955 [Bacteroidota bacterium]